MNELYEHDKRISIYGSAINIKNATEAMKIVLDIMRIIVEDGS